MLAYVAVVFFAVTVLLKETHPPGRRSILSPQQVVRNYRLLMGHWRFVATIILLSLVYLPAFLFNMVAPFLIESVLGHTAITSGHMALFVGAAWFGGNLTNRFMGRISLQRKSAWALWWSLGVAGVMIGLGSAGVLNLCAIVIPAVLIVMPLSVLFPPYMAHCLGSFKHIAASVNAATFAGIYVLLSAVTYIETHLHATTLIPLGITYAVLVLVSLVLYYGWLRKPWVDLQV